jgi:hypothetical protein
MLLGADRWCARLVAFLVCAAAAAFFLAHGKTAAENFDKETKKTPRGGVAEKMYHLDMRLNRLRLMVHEASRHENDGGSYTYESDGSYTSGWINKEQADVDSTLDAFLACLNGALEGGYATKQPGVELL